MPACPFPASSPALRVKSLGKDRAGDISQEQGQGGAGTQPGQPAEVTRGHPWAALSQPHLRAPILILGMGKAELGTSEGQGDTAVTAELSCQRWECPECSYLKS